mgnify:CR=1 FL=1
MAAARRRRPNSPAIISKPTPTTSPRGPSGRWRRLCCTRRFPAIIAGDMQPPVAKGSGRLELADSIVSPSNPLTARVLANRIWMHHFGEGLVRTPGNFGQLGERPTHPELLDHLAGVLALAVGVGGAIRCLTLALSHRLRRQGQQTSGSQETSEQVDWSFLHQPRHARRYPARQTAWGKACANSPCRKAPFGRPAKTHAAAVTTVANAGHNFNGKSPNVSIFLHGHRIIPGAQIRATRSRRITIR